MQPGNSDTCYRIFQPRSCFPVSEQFSSSRFPRHFPRVCRSCWTIWNDRYSPNPVLRPTPVHGQLGHKMVKLANVPRGVNRVCRKPLASLLSTMRVTSLQEKSAPESPLWTYFPAERFLPGNRQNFPQPGKIPCFARVLPAMPARRAAGPGQPSSLLGDEHNRFSMFEEGGV